MENLTIHNAIELGEDISLEAKGKGRHFQSRFIEAGLAHYEQFGDVLITKETLDKFIFSMVGCPVIIKHKDITEENADKERVGVVSKVWYNELDGWYWCEGIIWDKQAIDLVKNQGWSVSCTYDFESDFKKGTYHGKDYDMEFTGGEFLHLALVPNPRYERANIVLNAKDEEFITIGKGENARHIPLDYLLQKNEKFEVDVKGITSPQMNNITLIGRNIEKLNNITELYKKEQLLLKASNKESVREKIIEIAEIAKENLNNKIPEDSKSGEYLKNIISNVENYFLNEKTARELENKSNASFKPYIDSIVKNILGHSRDIEIDSRDGYTYKIEIKESEQNNIAKFIGDVLESSKFNPRVIGTSLENELFWLKIEFPKKDNKKEKEKEKESKMIDNAKDRDGREGEWITIKGNHIFIPKGESKDKIVKEFIDKNNKERYMPYDDAIKRDEKQIEYIEEKLKEDVSYEKERKLKQDLADLEDRIKYYKSQDKQEDKSEDNGEKDEIITHDKWDLKDFEEIRANETLKKDNIYIARKEIKYDNKVLPAYSEMKYKGNGEYEISGKNYKLNIDKYNLYHKKENKKNQNKVGFEGQLEFKKQYKKEFGSAPFYFDGMNAVDEKTDQNIEGATLNLTKEELTKKINEHFNKSLKEKEIKTKEDKIKYINEKSGSDIDISDSYSSKDIDKLYKHIKKGGEIHKINYEWVPKHKEQDKQIDKKESSKENPNIEKFDKEYKTIEGMIKRRNLEPRKEEELLEKLDDFKQKLNKNLEPHQEEELLEDLHDYKMHIYKNISANNSLKEKEITMTVLNELESFIKGIIKNAKEEEKFEEEEKEVKNKKAKNEEEDEEKEEKFEEEKEIAENKCKNEDEEEDDKEDKKEKVENSIEDTKRIVFGGTSEKQTDYIPHSKRIEMGNNY